MASSEGLAMLILVFIAAYVIWAVILLAGYVLKGLALFRMAKNAGLPNPMLAWVPFASTWMLGTLCDRSQFYHTGRRWNFAVILPILEATASLSGSILSGAKGFAAEIFLYADSGYSFAREAAGVLLTLAYFAAMVVAFYHLYRDYYPGPELLFAILSVILGGVGRGVLLMIVRDKIPLSAEGTPGAADQAPSCQTPPPVYQTPDRVAWHSGAGTTGWVRPPRQDPPGTTGWDDQPPGPPSNGEGPKV